MPKKKSAVVTGQDVKFSMKMSANLKSMQASLTDIAKKSEDFADNGQESLKSTAKLLAAEKQRFKNLDAGEKNFLNLTARRENISAQMVRTAQGYSAESDATLGALQGADKALTSAAKSAKELTDGAQKTTEFQEEKEAILQRIEELQLNAEGLAEDDIKNQMELLGLSLEQYDAAEKKNQITARTKEIQEGMLGIFGKSREEVEGMVAGFENMVANPMMAAIAIAGLLLNFWMKIVGQAMELRSELGISTAQAGMLATNIDSVARSYSMLGVSGDDVKATAMALKDDFGGIAILSKEVLKNVAGLQASFGIAGKDASALLIQMQAMGGASMETNIAMLETAASLAQAAGVAPADVMADIAANTATFAAFGKDGGKNIMKAAIHAKKLGVSMTEIAKAAESVMNIEESVNSEMEASVLLGRNVNMNKVREATLSGDLVTAQKEIVKQLGNSNDWNNMNYYQRKALAKAAGMEVDEVAKMMANQEKLNKQTAIQRGNMDAIAFVLKHIGRAWASLVDIAKMLIIPLGVITVIMLGWKGILGAGVLGLLVMILSAYQDMSGPMQVVTSLLLGLAAAAWLFKSNLLGSGGGGLIKGITKIGTSIMGMGTALTTMTPSVTALNTATGGKGVAGSVMGKKMNIKNILAGTAAIVLVAAGLLVFAFACQQLASISWGTIAMAAVGMLILVAAVALVGAIMMSGVGAVAIIAGALAFLIIAAALLVLGGALVLVAYAMSIMAEVIVFLGSNIQAMIAGIAGIFLMAIAFAALSYGMILLAIGMMVLAPMLPFFMLLTIVMGLFGISMMIVATAFTILAAGIKLLGSHLVSMVENVQGLKELGLAFILLGAGMIRMAFGLLFLAPMIPVLMLFVGILTMFGLAMTIVATAVQAMAGAISALGSNLIGLIAHIKGLAGLAGAFGMLGGSMMGMAVGLAMITPFLPTLMALAAIGGLAAGGMTAMMGGGEGGGEEDSALGARIDSTNAKLDQLITLYQEGGIINMDGKKVGDIIGNLKVKPGVA